MCGRLGQKFTKKVSKYREDWSGGTRTMHNRRNFNGFQLNQLLIGTSKGQRNLSILSSEILGARHCYVGLRQRATQSGFCGVVGATLHHEN